MNQCYIFVTFYCKICKKICSFFVLLFSRKNYSHTHKANFLRRATHPLRLETQRALVLPAPRKWLEAWGLESSTPRKEGAYSCGSPHNRAHTIVNDSTSHRMSHQVRPALNRHSKPSINQYKSSGSIRVLYKSA